MSMILPARCVGKNTEIPAGIDGIDYQIMIEADYLVTAAESNFSGNNVRNMLEKVFKTETGKFLLQSMYQKRLNAEE